LLRLLQRCSPDALLLTRFTKKGLQARSATAAYTHRPTLTDLHELPSLLSEIVCVLGV